MSLNDYLRKAFQALVNLFFQVILSLNSILSLILMNILITGGTGFLGLALSKRLLAKGHHLTLLTRRPDYAKQNLSGAIETISDIATLNNHYSVVINLAGEPIINQRWTQKRKALIRSSRIGLTQQLLAQLKLLPDKPDLLISGSAIGYYGDQGDRELTEASKSGQDFSAQLCSDWENEALSAEQLGIRVCILRTGLVLGSDGGMLATLLPSFNLGLGGRLGSGQHWQSWIHKNDWLAIVETLLTDTTMRGCYNATAPNPVRQAEFASALAKRLHRPALIATPQWLLRGLLGEMADIILASQRVLPQRLQEHGFTFQYPDLERALSALDLD